MKQVKQLPFAVTAIEWRDHHSKKEKEKLLKEKKFNLKRKQREEAQNAKRLKDTLSPIKKIIRSKIKGVKILSEKKQDSKDDVSCIYCN